MIRKGDKKIIDAWTFYDWANSVYPLVITTAIFPMFYNAKTKNTVDGIDTYLVDFFGGSFVNTELYSYVISASLLVVMIISPILSGISDYAGKKKFFLKLFCYMGSAACAMLFFFDVNYLEISFLAVFIASIGYWSSIVFYNSYLPEIAEPEDHDAISAKGFSQGYIGSVILLVINLSMIMLIGAHLTPYCFILVAIWWVGFAQITFKRLPANLHNKKVTKDLYGRGFKELKKVFNELKDQLALKRYLVSFLVLSMAVQTIMLMAQFFGMKEVIRIEDGVEVVGLSTTQLIIAIIMVQLIAIPGAFLFSKLSSRVGNIQTLVVAICMWIGACLFAFFIVDTPNEFYLGAGAIGLLMGGTQSMTRSTYSKMLPETEDTASYFSFYDSLEKLGIVVGTMSFGLIEGITGSMRNSILGLIFFFVIALGLLFLVPKMKPQKV